MPTLIDRNGPELLKKEDLLTFAGRHRPYGINFTDEFGNAKHFWENGPLLARYFYAWPDDEDDEDEPVARIFANDPLTIHLYTKFFVKEFMQIATDYEAYDGSVTVTVIVERKEEESQKE